jgi:hypothetical protein
MEDASFSFSVAEKYYNAQAKKIIEDYKKTPEKLDEYLSGLDKLIDNLKILIRLSPTSERFNILGSTYKRKALLIPDPLKKPEVYKKAAMFYQKAHTLKPDKWYALTNWLIIEGALILCKNSQWKEESMTDELDSQGNPIPYKLPSFAEAKEKLKKMGNSTWVDREIMNYWDMIATINIKLCEYVVNFTEASSIHDLNKILAELRDLWAKAGTVGKRFAEIDHVEFMIDEVSVIKNANTIKLGKYLNTLKEELMKLA